MVNGFRLLMMAVFGGASDNYIVPVYGGAVTAGVPYNPRVPGFECVRMFHSKGDVGCFSLDKQGTSARLVSVTTQDQISQLKLQEASILIIPESIFTKDNIDGIDAQLIKGLIVYPASSKVFNLDSPTPQGDGTVDGVLNPNFGNYSWNPLGRNVMKMSLPYPVLEVDNEEQAAEFVALAKKNEDAPVDSSFGVVWRAMMSYYFGPAKMDSNACLNFKNIYGQRSPKCKPVGGQSSWGIKGDLSNVEKPILMVVAPMDTNSFSHVLAPGANAGASGMAALLAAADALKTISSSSLNKNIIFAAFQAESYGFVGSRRFLADIQANFNNCERNVTSSAGTPFGQSFCASPVMSSLDFSQISFSRIESVIALDQLGLSANMSLHVNPNANKTQMDAFVKSFTSVPSARDRVSVSSVQGIPPGPLISFLNAKEFGNMSLVAATLSGYDAAFPSQYHSRFDVSSTINADYIVQAAQVLAEALYDSAAVASNRSVGIKVNSTLVQLLVSCITSDWKCPLMKSYSDPFVKSMIEYLSLTDSSWPSYMEPVSLYSGVYAENRMPTITNDSRSFAVAALPSSLEWQDTFRLNLFPNAYETFTRSFLASALGEDDVDKKTCTISKDCGIKLECVYPGVCKYRAAFFHDALSPGLKREREIDFYTILNATNPLWTEPNWNSLGTIVYPDPRNVIGYVSIGSGVISISIACGLAIRFLAYFRKQKLL